MTLLTQSIYYDTMNESEENAVTDKTRHRFDCHGYGEAFDFVDWKEGEKMIIYSSLCTSVAMLLLNLSNWIKNEKLSLAFSISGCIFSVVSVVLATIGWKQVKKQAEEKE